MEFTEEQKREIAKKAIENQLRTMAVDEYRKLTKTHQLNELLRIVKEANLLDEIKPIIDKETFISDFIAQRKCDNLFE